MAILKNLAQKEQSILRDRERDVVTAKKTYDKMDQGRRQAEKDSQTRKAHREAQSHLEDVLAEYGMAAGNYRLRQRQCQDQARRLAELVALLKNQKEGPIEVEDEEAIKKQSDREEKKEGKGKGEKWI